MKLHEFTDRLYAMGGIEQEGKKNRTLNESLNEMVQREDMREFMDDFIASMNTLNDKWNPGTWQLENAFEWYIDRCGDTEEDEEWLRSQEDFEESLTEARNPENDEVNAVLRKWANRPGNRLGKRDQKILDDAGIGFENIYDSGNEKVAKIKGGKNYLGKWNGYLKNNDKFDAVNYLKTDRPSRHDPTSYESKKLLRPYSTDYKMDKFFADTFSGERQQFKDEGNDKLEKDRDRLVKEHEKNMSDIIAKAKAKHPQYESLSLNESKQDLVDYFNELMSTFGVKPYEQVDYLLGYMSESELLDAIDDFKEYMDIDDEDIM